MYIFLGVPLKNILRKLQVKKKKLSTKKKMISIQDYTFLDKQKKKTKQPLTNKDDGTSCSSY